jgi:outer membrane lipoprotein SlyB
MILAAISVIIFSVVGIATMTGQVPSALSFSSDNPIDAKVSEAPAPGAAQKQEQAQQSRRVEVVSSCGNCGVIESVREIRTKGEGSGVGMAVGGVAGGLLGNQIGRGGGRTIATIAGAAGGAYVGNEVEKSSKSSTSYRITVRMEDGTYRTITQGSRPGHGVGDRVKLVDGNIVARG